MNEHDELDQTIRAWLEGDAGRSAPRHLLEAVAADTAARRPRPAWANLFHPDAMDRPLPVVGPTGRLVILLVIAATLLLGLLGGALLAGGPRRTPISLVPSPVVLPTLRATPAATPISTARPIPSLDMPAQHPYDRAANGLLLYDRGGDIFSAEPGGVGEMPLVTGPSTDDGALWSRDGTKFAFARTVSPDHVLAMAADADGSNVRQLSRVQLVRVDGLDWSPDGARLAIHHTIDGRGSISIATDDGKGDLRTLAPGDVEATILVGWRPQTGTELVFVGIPRGVASDIALYTLHPDGTGLRRIEAKHNESGDQISFQSASLSADGSEVIYWNWEPGAVADRCCSTHRLDLTTGEDRRMTYEPTPGGEIRPVLSPDGATVIFEKATNGVPSVLMTAPADANAKAAFVGPPFPYAVEHAFDISPDGSTIVLYIAGEKTSLIDIHTGAVTQLSQTLGDPPSWQRRAP